MLRRSDSYHALTVAQSDTHHLLDMAWAARSSCVEEAAFAETKLRETVLLVQFYSDQLDLARERLTQAEAWVGHVRARMRRCSVPILTQCDSFVAENLVSN